MKRDNSQLKNILEAALFAASKPLSVKDLSNSLFDEPPTNEQIEQVLSELRDDYAERGVELKRVASGYRFQVRDVYGQWVCRLWDEKPAKYSRALLETLALIAYRQPITRGEVEDIRGVAVSTHIIKTLVERDWVRMVGYRDVPGRPGMYATTREFLDYFNLSSLDQLPPLAEIRDLDTISKELGTMMSSAQEGEVVSEASTDVAEPSLESLAGGVPEPMDVVTTEITSTRLSEGSVKPLADTEYFPEETQFIEQE